MRAMLLNRIVSLDETDTPLELAERLGRLGEIGLFWQDEFCVGNLDLLHSPALQHQSDHVGHIFGHVGGNARRWCAGVQNDWKDGNRFLNRSVFRPVGHGLLRDKCIAGAKQSGSHRDNTGKQIGSLGSSPEKRWWRIYSGDRLDLMADRTQWSRIFGKKCWHIRHKAGNCRFASILAFCTASRHVKHKGRLAWRIVWPDHCLYALLPIVRLSGLACRSGQHFWGRWRRCRFLAGRCGGRIARARPPCRL